MEPWMSWAIVLALGGTIYFYYSHKSTVRGRHRGRSLQRAPIPTKGSAVQWSDSEATPKPAGKAAKVNKAPRKSVKKAVQEGGEKAEAYLSAASSTAGADADDDLSPTNSPALSAAVPKAPSGRDVSDMMEKSSAPPAVLKINPSEKPVRPSKPQQQKSETPSESKKARQNKRKAEEAKAQREADEKQRQVLLEKQRRTAREARGEAAKNGLGAAPAPASNAWTKVHASPRSAIVQTQSGQLLDTFDPEVGSTASSNDAGTNGTSATTESMSNSMNWTNLPSEEEQLRMAMEDSAWTTVPKGKKQRKNKAAGDSTAEEGSESGVPQEAAPVRKAPVPAPKTESAPPQSRFGLLAESDASTQPSSHPLDSDWSVA
ncbi:hypothetical protein BCR34DRAFT_497239 [Clohesyomyces aquaticus]|uniref:Uncharacterized protein n=1 Tax=Clohesyomyces aquaticus TaxID=1231657 RepID=A0A1Y1YGA3_9PLEO|nr:hypothetical protein BCR34DRAFT_497239 [Clohesyomyces aquaticus]